MTTENESMATEIEASLLALLGDNAEARAKWLSTPQELMNGKTPDQLLSSGDPEDLTLLLGLLRKVTGW